MTAEATGPSLVLLTVTWKSCVAVAPAVSVAVTRIVSEPTSSFRGVPEKVRVPGSKLSQEGNRLPSASVADRVSVSPTSTSVKLAGGTVKLKPASSSVDWSAMTAEAKGPSLVLLTVTVKSCVAVAPAVSVAVTRMVSTPTSPFRGVPEKLLVPGSKLSQAGSGLPSASVADRVSVSPTSTSLKLLPATVKLKPASSSVG